MKTFDLAWGNPYFLTELLAKQYNQPFIKQDIASMVYCEDDGMEKTIENVKNVIKQTVGLEYKHILITPGATHAINSCLRHYKRKGKDHVLTTYYGYPFYSDMISKTGMTRVPGLTSEYPIPSTVVMVDSPSNPFGTQHEKRCHVWDSVYHNSIYTNLLKKYPRHDVMVGSFSKLLGIAGARIGWIATDKPLLFEALRMENLHDTATISVPSQNLVNDVLNKINLNNFMTLGKKSLNDNRWELSKIEYLFDGQKVQESGMFYCAKADKKAKETLDRSFVKYVELDDEYVRISMGQTNRLTQEAVGKILKTDGK